MTPSQILTQILHEAQEADAALLTGNGPLTQSRVYEARQHLRHIVVLAGQGVQEAPTQEVRP